MKKSVFLITFAFWVISCTQNKGKSLYSSVMSTSNEDIITWKKIIHYATKGNPAPPKKVTKTEAEWKKTLTEQQFFVMREKGTERAFSNAMCSLFKPGIYACSACNTKLFDANEKFESGTGWPSFTQPIAPNVIAYIGDKSFGMYRIEAVCNVCDSHLGHVFPDGPEPSGLRYCMNAVSLERVEE